MGIWDRFSTMFRSNLNDLISRAENPEKMLNQLIVDMKTQLGKAKQQVASAIADEKKLQADAEALRKQAEDWERRAMLAVQEGKDDLAKQALMRYNEALQGAQQLHDTWLKHRAETEKLKLSLRQLNDKIEEAKRKKNILLARAKRAEAQQRIQETMSGMSDKGAFESFERMAEKIEAQERKAIASAELQEEFEGDSLIKQFEVLEYHGTADQALIELKRKMGVLPPASADKAKQLGPGRRGRARGRTGRRHRAGRRHDARLNGSRVETERAPACRGPFLFAAAAVQRPGGASKAAKRGSPRSVSISRVVAQVQLECRSRGSFEPTQQGNGPVALTQGTPCFRHPDYGVHGDRSRSRRRGPPR